MIQSVRIDDDHDANVFIEKLLRNGYWVHLKQQTTQEKVEDIIVIEFEKEEDK